MSYPEKMADQDPRASASTRLEEPLSGVELDRMSASFGIDMSFGEKKRGRKSRKKNATLAHKRPPKELNPGHDILDSMSDAPASEIWSVVRLAEDTGRTEREVKEYLLLLEKLDILCFKLAPLGRQGWVLTKLGVKFCGLLGSEK